MALRVAFRSGLGRLRGAVSPSSFVLQNSHLLDHSTSASAPLRPFSPFQITPVVHDSVLGNTFLRFGISSSASSQTVEKETNHSAVDQNPDKGNGATFQSSTQDTNAEDAESDLSVDDLVKLVAEKEELLKSKHKEIEKLQDKVLRSYAEMENVIDRTKREAENSKKFAIQSFAKSLLDVADNLERASSVVKDNFLKLDPTKDSAGAVPLLKTLLEGVEMTDKQLIEVLRKFGVEKFEPMDESFDPHRHNAVFQVPDATKPPGTVAVVLKSGYTLYDRVIRPAEVGVTVGAPGDEAQEGSGTK